MGMSEGTRMAYSELNSFIELLDEEEQELIPKKFKDFIRAEMDKNYVKVIDPDVEIKDQNLREETLALIAIIYLKYICDDEEEKQDLKRIYQENEKSYREIMKEKYNENNFFDTKVLRDEENVVKHNEIVISQKESNLNKFINKIKSLFR